jgi:predicted ATPase
LLTELRPGDFEGWEGKQAVRLAPLTLFFGRSGSGKSTLIRAVCDKAAGPVPSSAPQRLRRGDRELEEALGRWLTLMGLATGFEVLESEAGGNLCSLRLAPGEGIAHVPAVRAGSGASRALLVLVRAFASAAGTSVHLDHPESHLQPSAQSALGDALLAAVKTYGAQLLVETHSGLLLHRIQRRIAEESATKDDVAVHFIEARQGKTEIQELLIDEYGNITNWPQDFFGNEMDDLAAMTTAAVERRSR